MKVHRVAIIGLGIMGRRMIGNFERHPLFAIIGVWDPCEGSLAKTSTEYPAVKVAESPKSLINRNSVDLVYIACPPEFHI